LTDAIGRQRSQRGRHPGHDSPWWLVADQLVALTTDQGFPFYRDQAAMAAASFCRLTVPTAEGWKRRHEIEGLKLFLGVAEADRLLVLNPPDFTPALYEKLLPYAVALGVEMVWSRRFAAVTQLPPGMEPSPDLRLGPEGLTFVKTRCITAADPFPPMHDSDEVCKMDKTDVNGGNLRWSVTCATPKITVHQDWVMHYHGETMDGQFTLLSNMPDRPPIERTQQLKGRYLGPCDAK
jgi:hypothetical protein